MNLNIRIMLVVILSLFVMFSLSADIRDARESYRNGDTDGALLQYDDWLNSHIDSDEFNSVLFEVSGLKGDINNICRLLETQIKFVKPGRQKVLLYERLAQLYELGSNLQKAQLGYQNAALASLDSVDYKSLLQSALLLIMEGKMMLAESQLKEIIANSSDIQISTLANQYYVILKILNSLPKQKLISIDESPESLYLAYLVAKANDDLQTAANLKEQITDKFPLSPNSKLITGKIDALPNIITSFDLLKTELTETANKVPDNTQIHADFIIQVGSFKDPENAHFLALDIKKYNFLPVVEEQTINSTKYYKVLLYFEDEGSMVIALSKLKQKGFDGFPIY